VEKLDKKCIRPVLLVTGTGLPLSLPGFTSTAYVNLAIRVENRHPFMDVAVPYQVLEPTVNARCDMRIGKVDFVRWSESKTGNKRTSSAVLSG